MQDNLIIKALKQNPRKSIADVASMIKVPQREIGRAQREHIRPFIKRNSPLWGGSMGGVLKF